MPSNLVRTKEDEALWERAKKAAKESSGKDDNWALTNHIFQKMKTAHANADILEEAATTVQSAQDSYYTWLEGRNFELTPTDAGSHKDWLAKAQAALSALKELERAHARGNNYPVTKYSADEQAQITSTIALLERTLVSMSMIKIKKEDEDPLLKLLR